jgi:hypothetical protein
MKLYCVFGIEYHIGRELLGIYDSRELAVKRWDMAEENPRDYDEVKIDEIELNQDIE